MTKDSVALVYAGQSGNGHPKGLNVNWDDYRIFLAISKAGGLKKAARALNMHHTSCARRLAALEEDMGVRLFDRLPSGYRLTATGTQLAQSMRIINDEFAGIARNLAGKDLRLEGPLKLSLPNGFALELLMPDIKTFVDLYPDIDLDVNMTYSYADLASREVDVAIRHAENPPLSLAGRRVGRVSWCAYAAQSYLDQNDPATSPERCHWLGWGDPSKHLNWPAKPQFPKIPVRGNFYSDVLQLAAVREGMGIASLPCYIGDAAPGLMRLPKTKPEPRDWIWVLAHQDMFGNARVQALIAHLEAAFRAKKHLLLGTPTQPAPEQSRLNARKLNASHSPPKAK